MTTNNSKGFGWFAIFRLGLAQTALGAVVVLTTSTLNRVMVVELALAAMLPGALVTLHHALQLLRPRMGYGSDVGRRQTPWIVGGNILLAVGGVGAAGATWLMSVAFVPGLVAAMVAYFAIGVGVSASGTSLLTLMAKRVPAARRGGAATMVWMMMIFGFVVTAGTAGHYLDPFSYPRLFAVASAIATAAILVTVVAMWGLEGGPAGDQEEAKRERPPFLTALRQVWAEPDARTFTAFVFVSMLAYSAQDLILEPFSGIAFGYTPGESTSLSGAQHGGVFMGMLLVAVVTSYAKGTPFASLKGWVVAGCLGSGVAMLGLTVAGLRGDPSWPLQENVFLLGVANGVFSIAAIASMMTLANHGRRSREGTRMGLWGAAQAIAFGAGGFLGTVLVDAATAVVGVGGTAYALVFALEATGFFVAQYLASRTVFDVGREAPPAAIAAGYAQVEA
jgi:BCD family chlorophyll transporter-like MFS transporter